MKKYVGQNAIFYCETSKELDWQFNRGPLPSNAHTNYHPLTKHNSVTITNLNLENTGSYSCIGKKEGVDFISEGSLFVIGCVVLDI